MLNRSDALHLAQLKTLAIFQELLNGCKNENCYASNHLNNLLQDWTQPKIVVIRPLHIFLIFFSKNCFKVPGDFISLNVYLLVTNLKYDFSFISRTNQEFFQISFRRFLGEVLKFFLLWVFKVENWEKKLSYFSTQLE